MLLAVVTLAACQTETRDALEPGLFDPGLVEKQRAECTLDGGRWSSSQETGRSICFRTPPDANQSCQASTDCQGMCLARSRTCAPVVPFFGCHEVLNARGAIQTLCIE